jgi:ribosome-associated protein
MRTTIGVRNASWNPSRNFRTVDKLHTTVAALRAAIEPSLNRMATSLSSVTARESAQRVQRAAQLCLDMKANEVVLLNLQGVTDMTDYFVIASGTSDTHVRSIGEHVISEMKKVGLTVHHTEGLQQGRWVLLDFFDFVVHIFHPTLRSFYQIERLWSDAETVALEPQE